jgi:hypothetical protein
MVINEPEEFKVRKQVMRKGKPVMAWVDLRKGVGYLFRYREVSLGANGRYLDALAQVDDPTDAIRTLDRLTTPKQVAPQRTAKAFNPIARDEVQIFRALLSGDHTLRGFSNPELRDKLRDSPHLKNIEDPKRKSGKVTRILGRCHAHGLIAKIPRSRRWRVTKSGRIAMSAAIQLRDMQFPLFHSKAAA